MVTALVILVVIIVFNLLVAGLMLFYNWIRYPVGPAERPEGSEHPSLEGLYKLCPPKKHRVWRWNV